MIDLKALLVLANDVYFRRVITSVTIEELSQLFWVYTSLCDEVWSDPSTPLSELESHLCSLLNTEVLRRKVN